MGAVCSGPRGSRSQRITFDRRSHARAPADVRSCACAGIRECRACCADQAFLPAEKSCNVAVISYTLLEPLQRDKAKCIPMLGQLLGLAYTGHNVIVFEGHATALEPALRDCDVLLIDSGMVPFLQKDWLEVAFKSMPAGAKVFVCDRKTLRWLPVVRSNNAQGWRIAEPDGEASYANCMLLELAKGADASVLIDSTQPVPNLADLTSDPAQLKWISELPFRYEALDAARVINIILKAADWQPSDISRSTGVLKAQVPGPGGQRQSVAFDLTVRSNAATGRQLSISKVR